MIHQSVQPIENVLLQILSLGCKLPFTFCQIYLNQTFELVMPNGSETNLHFMHIVLGIVKILLWDLEYSVITRSFSLQSTPASRNHGAYISAREVKSRKLHVWSGTRILIH